VTLSTWSLIQSNWYYLITKNDKSNSILNIDSNLTDNNLNITWTQLVLNNWVMDIDFASLTLGLFDTGTPKSMERKDNIWDWILSANWYTAQDSVGFDNSLSLWTPWTINKFDSIAPTINSYTPNDNSLLPLGSLDIELNYTDNTWWLWINTLSDNISLKKWDWNSWGTNLSLINIKNKLITSTSSKYHLYWLEYWKYKIDFNISDKAWNIVNKTIIFYVDKFSFDINSNTINIWDLISWINIFSETEVILTVKTVWAWFTINMLKNWFLTNNWSNIIDYDWNYWFWYEKYNWGYLWNLHSISTSENIVTNTWIIDNNWILHTYIYKIKFWANINIIQWAWNYTNYPEIEVLTNY
jgi:hypothetical protein